MKDSPIVVQFSDLEDFVKEADAEHVRVVRVWPGQAHTGNGQYPGVTLRVVNAQAVNREGHVLSASVVVGTYEELYGRPFGPSAERRKAIVDEHISTAVAAVKDRITQKVSAEIRPGSIATGLSVSEIQRAYWEGLGFIYTMLKEAADA